MRQAGAQAQRGPGRAGSRAELVQPARLVVGDPDRPAADDRRALRAGRAAPPYPDLASRGVDRGQPALRARLVHDAALDRGRTVRLADVRLVDLPADTAEVRRVEQV